MMRTLRTLKNNMIKTSNNTYEPLKLESPNATIMFFMNNPELCSDVLETSDKSTRDFIISGLVKHSDMQNHDICMLIAKYGDIHTIINMLDSPYEDVNFEAKTRLFALQLDGIMTDMLNIIYK